MSNTTDFTKHQQAASNARWGKLKGKQRSKATEAARKALAAKRAAQKEGGVQKR